MADEITPNKLQSIDTSILDTIKNDQGGKLLETAQKEYPYLSNKSIAYKYTPSKDFRQLEFYHGEDLPDWAKSAGKQTAIETFNPSARPIDILGDYVSHYAVKQDPQLMSLYQQFSQNVPKQTYQKRLNETIQNLQESIKNTNDPEQKKMLSVNCHFSIVAHEYDILISKWIYFYICCRQFDWHSTYLFLSI